MATTIRHSAVLGIGAKLAPSWSAGVGAVTSGTSKIKNEVKRLKSASHETADALKGMLASGDYYGKSAESVRRARIEHEKLTTALAHEERRLRSLKAWNEIDAGNRASAALGRIGSGLATVGKYAVATGAVLGGAAAGGIAWFTKSALDATSKLETMQTSLETLEGSPEKAKKSVDWITKFAAETPYKLEEVGEAYTRLRAYGIDPTNGSLRTLGDTAGSLGKPIMSAVEALADAVTGENERLKEFGIRSKTAGDKITYFYRNAAGKEMVKTVSKNSQVAIAATLQAIWNEKYAGGMQKQSRTWAGLMSTLSDQWMLFQVRVMKSGVFDRLKVRLEALSATITRWADDGTLDRWAARIGDAYTYAFDKIGEGFEWLRANWPQIKTTMSEAWSETQKFAKVAYDVGSWLVRASGGAGNLAIAIGALGAAKTLAPMYELVKIGGQVVAWMLRASALAPAITGAATAASGTAAAGGAAAAGGTAAAGGAVAGALGVAALGAAAGYGGYKLAEYVDEKENAKKLATPEARAKRAAEHERKLRESQERVRSMRALKAAEAAMPAVESDGLLVAPAPSEPTAQTAKWRPPPAAAKAAPAAPAAPRNIKTSKSDIPTPPAQPGLAPIVRQNVIVPEQAPVAVEWKPPKAAMREAAPARTAAPEAPRMTPTSPAPAPAKPSMAPPTAGPVPQPPAAKPTAAPEAPRMAPTIAPQETRNLTTPPAPAPVTQVHKYDQRKIEINVEAKGADADEVARKLEQRMQSEALASYE